MTILNEHWHELPVLRGFEPIKTVYESVNGRGYIAGSYAAYMSNTWNDFKPGDVDIFAVREDAAEDIWTDLCINLGYVTNSHNDVAISLVKGGCLPVQIVRPSPDWAIFPDDILNSFDMNVCRGVLIAPDKLLGDVELGMQHGKLLRMHNPLRTLKRVMKYQARRVQFNDHELLKMFRAWEGLPDDRKAEMLSRAQEEAFPTSDSSDGDYLDWYEDDDDWFEGE